MLRVPSDATCACVQKLTAAHGQLPKCKTFEKSKMQAEIIRDASRELNKSCRSLL